MHFDAYVMVDWSANAGPKTGSDSIWWCIARRKGGSLRLAPPVNTSTRKAAIEAIRACLLALVAQRLSVLVGFDFPYAYPRGFAASLGLAGEPWRAVWDELSRRVVDDQERSVNNRFEVAAALNRRIAGSRPFWGCPASARCDALLPTKGKMPCGPLEELRATERRLRGPKSCWQLFYTGSAGSQALLGIPYLARLRDDPALAPVSRVWPFETGPLLPPRTAGGRVIHAEIYPSLVPAAPAPGEAKDSAQVRAIARHFAARDRRGDLDSDFTAPESVPEAWHEEGWILGLR